MLLLEHVGTGAGRIQEACSGPRNVQYVVKRLQEVMTRGHSGQSLCVVPSWTLEDTHIDLSLQETDQRKRETEVNNYIRKGSRQFIKV